jgi:hypothetical protein
LHPIASTPFTLIVDSRLVAVVPDDAHSAAVNAAWQKLDPEKIKSIEVYSVPRAQQCYPAALGTLVVTTQR